MTIDVAVIETTEQPEKYQNDVNFYNISHKLLRSSQFLEIFMERFCKHLPGILVGLPLVA